MFKQLLIRKKNQVCHLLSKFIIQQLNNESCVEMSSHKNNYRCHLNIFVMVCKGRGYNFYFLAPCGGRLFNSHMTYDITSCICDATSCV